MQADIQRYELCQAARIQQNSYQKGVALPHPGKHAGQKASTDLSDDRYQAYYAEQFEVCPVQDTYIHRQP